MENHTYTAFFSTEPPLSFLAETDEAARTILDADLEALGGLTDGRFPVFVSHSRECECREGKDEAIH